MLLKDADTFIKPAKEKFKNATRKNRCPICNGIGCAVNSQIVLCWRVEAGSKERVKSGAYLHFRNNYDTFIPIQVQRPVEPKATSEVIAQVYRDLLSCLVLEDKHITALKARGLNEQEIVHNGYRSTPTKLDGQIICKYLSGIYNLDYVPGFHQAETRRLNVQGSGIFIPYRNIDGTIRAMQVRPDRSSAKYFWFSSADLHKGASSGSFVHYARPTTARAKKEIHITEGALKADCISTLAGVGVAAIAGVTAVNYDTLVEEIKTGLPEVEKIIIAFDIDWKTNPHVQRPLMALYEVVKKSFLVEIEDWDAKLGKGLDDKLLKEKNAKNN